jgi:hypothetical protein
MEPITTGDCGRILELHGRPDSISFFTTGGSQRYVWIYKTPSGKGSKDLCFIFGNINNEQEFYLLSSSNVSDEGEAPS